MNEFKFTTDAQSKAFINEVVRELVLLFDMPEMEAIGRINRHWRNQTIVGDDDMIYHESPDFYAKTIYYGPNVAWWKGEAGLKAVLYP